MSEAEWHSIARRLEPAFAEAGFDLVQPFSTAAYNDHAQAIDRLPDFERERTLAFLVGNTRALWPVFLEAARDPALAREDDPLDVYVERTIPRLLASATRARTHIIFAHATSPRAFPVQRVAERAGLAALAPSHLAVHPMHGPWIALRAIAIVDVAGPASARTAARPCDGCSAPCVPALDRALAMSGPIPNQASISANAAAWIAVRDACPVGRASRYGEAQLRYHYGLDRSLLQRA